METYEQHFWRPHYRHQWNCYRPIVSGHYEGVLWFQDLSQASAEKPSPNLGDWIGLREILTGNHIDFPVKY